MYRRKELYEKLTAKEKVLVLNKVIRSLTINGMDESCFHAFYTSLCELYNKQLCYSDFVEIIDENFQEYSFSNAAQYFDTAPGKDKWANNQRCFLNYSKHQWWIHNPTRHRQRIKFLKCLRELYIKQYLEDLNSKKKNAKKL
jgi:hypothetical protein